MNRLLRFFRDFDEGSTHHLAAINHLESKLPTDLLIDAEWMEIFDAKETEMGERYNKKV